MSLSRKEFLTQGVFSLGKMLLPPQEPRKGTEARRLIRPPGFIPEKVGECGSCDQCRTACPEEVITRLKEAAGPVMEFNSGGCRFCYLCIGACPNGVLTFPGEECQPRLGQARTAGGCIASGGCFTCSERCPEGAIEIAWGSGVRIDPERCTGCGICESCCPVHPKAIRVEPLNTGL